MLRFGNPPAGSQISFALLLACSATMILRPSDMLPMLQDAPLYELLIAGALCFGWPRLVTHFRWRNLRQQPATLCVAGVLGAIVLSHATNGYFSGAMQGATDFLKSMLLYGLVVSQVETTRRLRTLMIVVAMSATATVGLCVADFLEIVDFEGITHLADHDGVNAANETASVARMRGIGIFQDPNDVAMLIVFAGVIWGSVLCDRSRGASRIASLLPLGILATGLLCTKSRGGLLSAAAAFLVLTACRFGRRAAMACGILAVTAIPFAAGRQSDFGFSSGGTGLERITLWREGLFALRSPALPFGIGQGVYADLAGLAAHNSFVHAFVELGLFGGTLFLGCFFFPALALYRLRNRDVELDSPDLRRLFPFLVAMLAGWTMGLQALSRNYVVSTYLVLGLQAAYGNLAGAALQTRRLLVSWDQPHIVRLAACSLALFVAFNVFVVVVS